MCTPVKETAQRRFDDCTQSECEVAEKTFVNPELHRRSTFRWIVGLPMHKVAEGLASIPFREFMKKCDEETRPGRTGRMSKEPSRVPSSLLSPFAIFDYFLERGPKNALRTSGPNQTMTAKAAIKYSETTIS